MAVTTEFFDIEEQQEQAKREQEARLDALLSAIDSAEETAYGSEQDGDLAKERSLAIRFYLGENVEPAPEGRSQVSDRSVFETVQWILPSLLRIFAGGGNVVQFEPLGPDDEKTAEQESDYLNYIVTQKNRWFDILLAWFQDALLTKNAYCLAYMEDRLHTETERYSGQSEEQITFLAREEGVEIVQFSQYPDPNGQPQLVADPATGMPMVKQPMLADIVIRKNKPESKLCFRVLPPERVKVSSHTPNHTLDECDYFEYWDYKTISEIRSLGINIPDDIEDSSDGDTQEDNARDRFGENIDSESSQTDPAMRRVKLRTIWIRHDTDGNGIAELQRVMRIGREILYLQEESRIPVSSIVPFILTHRHVGVSLADIVVDIQRIMTAIQRQGLDNLYQTNNVRQLHSKLVDLDSLLSSVPGGTVEVDTEGPVDGHVLPLVPTFVFPQAIAGLEYMDAVKEKRTGLNKTFSGVDEGAIRQTASGIAQLSTMAAQRVEQIARVFAPGIEYLFSVAHELLLKHGHKPDVVKLRGQWVAVDPRTWKTGRDLKLSVGFGAGNKDIQAARAANIWQMQLQAAQSGSRIVQEANLYESALAYAKAADFTVPEKFWTDPRSLPPPQPPPPSTDQIYAMVEKEKIASGERQKAADLASGERIKKAELEQQDRETLFKGEIQLALEKMKLGGQAEIEVVKGKVRDEGERAKLALQNGKDLEKTVTGEMVLKKYEDEIKKKDSEKNQLLSKFDGAVKNLSAPKEIVRENGKIVGVKQGDVVRKVIRDKDGKVTGLK
jgi:hypothetical protein